MRFTSLRFARICFLHAQAIVKWTQYCSKHSASGPCLSWGTLPFHVGNLSQWKRSYITPMIFMRSTTKFTCNYSFRSIAFLGVKVGEEKMASFKIRRVSQSRDTVRQKKSIAILPFYTYLSSCYLSRACKFKKCVVYFLWTFTAWLVQRAKKVVSDSPGLVDFVIGLVNSVFNLPDGQVMFFWGIRITEELWNQFCSSKSFWG